MGKTNASRARPTEAIAQTAALDDPTRRALIHTALHLFAEDGVKGVSIRRITAMAGAANQSAVHYHFNNKLGLVRAVLDAVNERLAPLQHEALAELAAMAKKKAPTVREVMAIGLSPYVYLFQQPEGPLALRFLSRLTWESGDDAQELMLEKVRPYFLKLLPHLRTVLPHKPAGALDLQLFMAAANVIHGLADITLFVREPLTDAGRLYRDDPETMLRYFFDYISSGLGGSCR